LRVGRLTPCRTGIKIKTAEWVNILEEAMPGKEAECPFQEKEGDVNVLLDLRHFEIKTLKIVLA
jgi:hypothetical protein